MNHSQLTTAVDQSGCVRYAATQASADPTKRRKRDIKKLVYKCGIVGKDGLKPSVWYVAKASDRMADAISRLLPSNWPGGVSTRDGRYD